MDTVAQACGTRCSRTLPTTLRQCCRTTTGLWFWDSGGLADTTDSQRLELQRPRSPQNRCYPSRRQPKSCCIGTLDSQNPVFYCCIRTLPFYSCGTLENQNAVVLRPRSPQNRCYPSRRQPKSCCIGTLDSQNPVFYCCIRTLPFYSCGTLENQNAVVL